ncbi:MAG: hypothetical protein ACKOW2_04505 [Sphingobacteriaceae bacterium]
MTYLNFCTKCNDYLGINNTKCNCKKFEVFDEENRGDEPKVMYGKSELEVIERYAEDNFYSDPCEPDDFVLNLSVNGVEYKVKAQAEISFWIDET